MMMDRILLGVLYLSGWHIFATGQLHQYHYYVHLKTWTEAQAYCRERYTDLATINTAKEMTQFINTVSSYGHNLEVWIGLYSLINWKWSNGSTAEYRNWERSDNEPNFKLGKELCVTVVNGGWWDDDCAEEFSFICYSGTQQDPVFVFVNESRNWSSAQRYCRENFTDLATVRDDTENKQIQNLMPSGTRAWIGLFRDPNIHWSDGSRSSFKYWDDVPNSIDQSMICVIAVLQSSGKWRTMRCDSMFPFVCYSVLPAEPVMRQVVKLRTKPENSSVNLNDPAVKTDILKKLQARVNEEGMTGVTLKWAEQHDGKAFHKEGRSSQKKNRKKTEL